MIKDIEKFLQKYYGEKPKQILPLGGEFYGRVFMAETKGQKIALKLYLYDSLAVREERQLKILSQSAVVPMPQVLFLHHKDMEIGHDILAMEYMEGVNAGLTNDIDPQSLDKIAEKIIDNLVAYHKTVNIWGFGEIGATTFVHDWREFYKPKAAEICEKAKALNATGKIDGKILGIMQKAYENFDRIFYLPIETARLIHGDYNPWNILLNSEKTDVAAVIDPFNCCWGDSEFDLYQLDNANGKYYNLLNRYKERVNLSENFELKRSFYELFTEIMHFHDADADMTGSAVPVQAEKLAASI